MRGPGRWTRMAYFWPLLQSDPPQFGGGPPKRRPPEPPVEEFEEAPGDGAPPAQPPEEFEETPSGAPPVQAPEEFEETPPAGGAPAVDEFGEAGEPATAGEPEEFEPAGGQAQEVYGEPPAAEPAQAPVEFEAPPAGGAPPVGEFEEASGEPARAGEPEAIDVAPEQVEETAPVSLRTAPPRDENGRPPRGLTNGLTNGRGRTNGRGLTNGRSGVNGRGLTNGRGRTNGRGLTNGGLTNGRSGVNGRGLTNGRGMVNGRRKGLVNGAGLTNGAGLVNGRRRRGLVNGNGLVDGNGFINGRGLVNGKGLINGQGLTNGRQLTTAEVVPSRPKVRRNVGVIAAVLAVALLIIIPVLYYTQIQKGIAIDGVFDDWKGVTNKYSDGDAQPSPSTDANIDITEFGSSATDTDLSLYLKVSGSMLRGAGDKGLDTLTVFISSGRSGTGYRVNSPGGLLDADYKLEIYGYDGSVRSAAYSKFDGNSNDYNGWSSIGAARAAVSGSELEASVWFQGTELSRSSDISILFYLRDAAGEEDYSDFTIGMDTGVLAVRQRDPGATGDGATVPLELGAYGRQINLTSLRVTKAGPAGGGTVTLTGAGDPREAGFGGADAIFAGLTVSMAQDSRILLSLRAQGFSGGAFGMYISGSSALQANTGGRPVHVSVSGYSNTLYYAGGAAAGDIRIDGAFEDWDATRGMGGYDSRGDSLVDDIESPADARSPGLVPRGGIARYSDPNVNLQEIAEYNPETGTVYYYAAVEGKALGGQLVPATKRSFQGPGGFGGGGNPPEHVGSDVLYVLIDSDGNKETGYGVTNSDGDPVIGANYCIVITGKNGVVLSKRSFRFDGGWQEGGPSPDAAASGRKVEVSVGGVSLAANHKALIIAEDWTGNADRSDTPVGRIGRSAGAAGPTLEVNEADVSRHAVQVGSKLNPMFRLEMDAAGGPVEVTGIELSRDGTARDADITGVHLLLDADGDGVFSRTDPELAAAMFQDGKALMTGTPIITAVPGQRLTFFVSVDVSSGATLYTTFGVKVSGVTSSASAVELANTKATTDVVLARTGGRDSIKTHVVINEIAYTTVNSVVVIDWVELVNPTSSAVDLKNWKLQYDDGAGGWGKLYKFNNGESINGNLGYYTVTGLSGVGIASGVRIQLVDTNPTVIDGPLTPSAASGKSYGRYSDASGYPTTDVGQLPSVTQGDVNPQIPEFKDIIFPMTGIVVTFLIIRRQRVHKTKRKHELVDEPV